MCPSAPHQPVSQGRRHLSQNAEDINTDSHAFRLQLNLSWWAATHFIPQVEGGLLSGCVSLSPETPICKVRTQSQDKCETTSISFELCQIQGPPKTPCCLLVRAHNSLLLLPHHAFCSSPPKSFLASSPKSRRVCADLRFRSPLASQPPCFPARLMTLLLGLTSASSPGQGYPPSACFFFVLGPRLLSFLPAFWPPWSLFATQYLCFTFEPHFP